VNVNTYPLFQYPPYSLSLTSKMVDVVRHEALDLLHVHYAIPHAMSAVMARSILAQEGIRTPVVTTLHGTDITIVGQDPSFVPVVTYSINASDGVTAVSDFLRRETYEAFDVNNGIEVIPNFIDTKRFYRLGKEHFKKVLSPLGEKVIMHVSNFRPVKNVPHVIQIFHRLLESNLSVKLVLVGDGPDRVPSEHLARKLGVYEEVRFLGKQEPIEEILSIADVFLMPSGSESFGLAALEAMACGVPVVCSDIDGLPELMQSAGAGFLCPLGDIDVFTECTRRILTDEELHTRMSQAARNHVVDNFDLPRIVTQYEEYYERVIADTMRL